MKYLKKLYVLLLTLCFLPSLQAQEIIHTIKETLLRAVAYKQQTTVECQAKQEHLDAEHKASHEELLQENIKMQQWRDASYPRISETNLPYLHRWFNEFKQNNSDAGFTSEIILREHGNYEIPNQEEFEKCWGFMGDKIALLRQLNGFKNTAGDEQSIYASTNSLKALNELCKIKYTTPCDFYDGGTLVTAEGLLIHSLYYLLEPTPINSNPCPPFTLEDEKNHAYFREKELRADEHLIIHGTKEQASGALTAIHALKLYREEKPHYLNGKDDKDDTSSWGNKKAFDATLLGFYTLRTCHPLNPSNEDKNAIESITRMAYLKAYPNEYPVRDRIKYFLQLLDEKKTIEESMRYESPRKNEAKLQRLLDRGPRNTPFYNRGDFYIREETLLQ